MSTPADLARCVDEVWHRLCHPTAVPGRPLPARRRVVVLLTSNERKLPEYRKHLDRYDIEIFQGPRIEEPAFLTALLARSTDAVKILALLVEESNLFGFRTDQYSTLKHLERVENVSTLRAYRLVDGQLRTSTYRHATEGYIDRARHRPDEPGVFGWDDVFVVKNTGLTYHELCQRDLKVSSRDMVLSEFLHEHVYYRPGIDLRFNPQEQGRPIDFANPVAEFVRDNPHLNNPAAGRLTNAWQAVVNDGAFFRSPENRREKNYWLPGLNAGIPFVPKKDPIHEITYMAHDLGHFLLPDLVYTGQTDDFSRRVYIVARMMSEAITLVLADMLFVESLARSGHEYDWGKRCIYPLYVDLGIDLTPGPGLLTNLETLLRANVRYCLRGDDGGYRDLLAARGAGTENLERFKEKYMPFFVEDFRWTVRNWTNLASHADFFRRWWSAVSPLRDAGRLALQTIDELAAQLDPADGDLVDQVFARLFKARLRPIFEAGRVAPVSAEAQLGRAFFKYMLGQLGLMVAFDFVPESAVYLAGLRDHLVSKGAYFGARTIERYRGYYEQFVDLLLEKNLIAGDDARTYKEVYPLFPPVFVHYDEQEGYYVDLAEVSRRVLEAQP